MVAKKKSTAVANIKDEIQLPAYMKSAGNAGNENVSNDDVSLPRLSLLQSMSPEVQKGNAKFIDGAEPGMFLNSITKELYADVNIINVYYRKEWPIFRKRDAGGGYLGTYNSQQEAEDFIATHTEGNNLEAAETANHYCILINDEGAVIDKVVFSLTSTKLRFSRNWNSLIMGREGARFSWVWNIKSVSESNKKGTWASPVITSQPVIATQEAFEYAQETYDGLMRTISAKAA